MLSNTPKDTIPSDNYLFAYHPHYHPFGRQPWCSSRILLRPYIFMHPMSTSVLSLSAARNHISLSEGGPQEARTPSLCTQRTRMAWKLMFQQWQPPRPVSELPRNKDSSSPVSWSCMTGLQCSCNVFWSSPREWGKGLPSCSTSFSTWPQCPTALPVFLVTLLHKSLSHKSLFQDLFLENPT